MTFKKNTYPYHICCPRTLTSMKKEITLFFMKIVCINFLHSRIIIDYDYEFESIHSYQHHHHHCVYVKWNWGEIKDGNWRRNMKFDGDIGNQMEPDAINFGGSIKNKYITQEGDWMAKKCFILLSIWIKQHIELRRLRRWKRLLFCYLTANVSVKCQKWSEISIFNLIVRVYTE